MRTTGRRRGFTLVELLVVIAIIGILVALLLPAVQSAREAARRMQCSNNLKQLGVALHNYHDTHQCFPAGYYCLDQARWDGNVNLTGWQVRLLPYMEQQALYDAVKEETNEFRDAFDESATGLAKTVLLDTLVCPSCPMDDINNVRANNFMKCNYVAVAGSRPYNLITNDTSHTPNPGDPTKWYWKHKVDGIFFNRSFTRMAKITDGTSNTLAIAERGGGKFVNGAGDVTQYSASSWIGSKDPRQPNVILTSTTSDPRWTINGTTKWQPMNSSHPGGVNCCRADGSVSFISETINGATFEALGSRDGGEVVTE